MPSPPPSADDRALAYAWAGLASLGARLPASVTFSRIRAALSPIASRGNRCTLEYAVPPSEDNGFGAMYGGSTVCLVDYATSLALLLDGAGHAGASLDIQVQFVGFARVGEVLVVKAWVDRKTRTAAFARCEVRKKGVEGEAVLVATASHTKAIMNTPQVEPAEWYRGPGSKATM
ncbi:HotDog domain-containing protein [Hyaloraphidium curvatum]|nr:HotDog domain-containing protein [Hyaloraphidium curvatum]